MALKKKFLLRIDPDVYGALEKWATDELRSVNAQMEFVLREALRRVGRERTRGGRDRPDGGSTPPETGSEP